MKFTLVLSLFCFAQVAFADDLEDSLKPPLSNIYDTLTQQSEQAVTSCLKLEASLNDHATRTDIDTQFKNLLLDWKRVQAIYVVSEYHEDAIDFPHYIDVYHRSNENLQEQIARALRSDQPAKTALFKHSFKSINALEYVLYASGKQALDARQMAFAQTITTNICGRLRDIHDVYIAEKTAFLNKPKKAVAVLLNELIDSSYKLKEWRLGDAAGVSRKRRGKPNATYLEYGLSQLNLPVAQVILSQHTMLTQPKGDFATIIALLAEHDEIEEPIDALTHARRLTQESVAMLKTLSEADLIDSAKVLPVYKTLNELNDSYFVELIESLSDIVARILDSDGD